MAGAPAMPSMPINSSESDVGQFEGVVGLTTGTARAHSVNDADGTPGNTE